VQSIFFKADLVPLEKASAKLSVHVDAFLRGALLKLHYTFRAEELRTRGVDAFAWEEAPSGFSETLWKKSCFEIFIADPTAERYWEWNFAPTAWGAFSFAGPRTRCPLEARKDAGLRSLESDTTKISEGILSLHAELDLSFSEWLAWATSNQAKTASLLVSLNAITLSTTGERVHWALRHAASGKADFHERAHFSTLENLSF